MADTIRIILNGKLFEDQHFAESLRDARERHPEGRIIIDAAYEPSDVARLAREACELKAEVVVSAGGDGTLHAVLDGLGGTPRPELGVLPLGTGNDFASSLGLTQLDQAFDVALSSQVRLIDVGRVRDRRFLNVATGGFGPDVTAETPEPLKRSLGGFAYLVAAMTHVRRAVAREIRVETEGFEWEGRAYGFAIGNSRLAGGGHRVCPDALIDDGKFDLAILPEVEDGTWLGALKLSVDFGWQALESRIIRYRASRFSLQMDEDVHVNLDGEPIVGDAFEFDVEPKSQKFRLPPDARVLT